MDDDVWDGYSTAVVRLDLDGGALRLEPRPCGEVGKFAFAAPVHIITAYNPEGREADASLNENRHVELLELMSERDIVSTVGSAPDGSFAEPGCAIFDLGLDEALALGRLFGQRAIYRWTASALTVVAVGEPRRTEAGWALVRL
jgi:hypothetical protein